MLADFIKNILSPSSLPCLSQHPWRRKLSFSVALYKSSLVRFEALVICIYLNWTTESLHVLYEHHVLQNLKLAGLLVGAHGQGICSRLQNNTFGKHKQVNCTIITIITRHAGTWLQKSSTNGFALSLFLFLYCAITLAENNLNFMS